MGINRRQFLGMLSASPLFFSSLSWANSDLYASAGKGKHGGYVLSLFDVSGNQHLYHQLPDRAHQVVAHPSKPWLFAIARRPGTYIDVVDMESKQLLRRLTCEPGYHLFGHAQITSDGRYLLTTEKSPKDDLGKIVIRDIADNFQVIEEFSTAGVGPHEFILSENKSKIVVANGGILTEGRKKINLDTMQPSLTYLDTQSGTLLEKAELDPKFHQSSIRHIDINAANQVVIAMQYQGHLADRVPLIASHVPGSAIQPIELPETSRQQLKQYCGSACFDKSGQFAAISAPRGNKVLFFDMERNQYLGEIKTKDGCGLAQGNRTGDFIITTGLGRVYQTNAESLERKKLFSVPVHWDNHLTQA